MQSEAATRIRDFFAYTASGRVWEVQTDSYALESSLIASLLAECLLKSRDESLFKDGFDELAFFGEPFACKDGEQG